MALSKENKIRIAVLVIFFVALAALMLPRAGKKRARAKKQAAHSEEVHDYQLILSTYRSIEGTTLNRDTIEGLQDRLKAQKVVRDPFKFLADTGIEEEVEVVVITAEDEEAIAEKKEDLIINFPEVDIQGILYEQTDPNSSIAFIGADEMRIGDKLAGWTITAMTDSSVTFVYKDYRKVVNLYEE